MKKTITLALILIALASTAAFADRDIVYSARYYAPGGSNFHLYRINPDGTGKEQITSGRHDDRDPQWSPDGKSIVFARDVNNLCIVDADGRHLRTITTYSDVRLPDLTQVKWWPDSSAVIVPSDDPMLTSVVKDAKSGRDLNTFEEASSLSPSPDGENAYVDDGNGGSAAKLTDGRQVTIQRSLPVKVVNAAWVTSDAFVGIISTEGDASDQIIGFDENGTRLWTRDIHPIRPTNSDLGVGFARVVALPNDYKEVILAEDIGTSTVQPNYNYYRTSVDTGNAPLWLSAKQFLTFSKPGAYVTSSAKDLTNYGAKKHGRQPQVWTADLEIGRSPDDAHPKPIVHGLVWVDSADWRR